MRHALSLLAACLLLVSCAHAPAVRPGPPVETHFAPPPGNRLTEHFLQRRQTRVEFRDSEPVQVLDMVSGSTRETFEPLPDGGWRVTSTVTEEASSRDGVATQQLLSLRGVPFVHVVDAQGRFVRAERLQETLDALRERVSDPRARKLLESLFTPEFLAQRMERSWTQRFAHVCNAPLAPGAAFFLLDEQELPAGGPARSLVEERVVGQVPEQRQVELALTFGGSKSRLVQRPGAPEVLRLPAGGLVPLTEQVEGRGTRLVVPDSCQTVRETAHLEGHIDQKPPAGHEAPTLPTRIEFTVEREVWRTW